MDANRLRQLRRVKMDANETNKNVWALRAKAEGCLILWKKFNAEARRARRAAEKTTKTRGSLREKIGAAFAKATARQDEV